MMIVAMYDIRKSFFILDPIQESMLKSYPLLRFIRIAVDFFTIQFIGNFYQIKRKSQTIVFLFENSVIELFRTLIKGTFAYHIKVVILVKRFVKPRHHHLRIDSQLALIFRQRADDIGQSTYFRYGKTLHT